MKRKLLADYYRVVLNRGRELISFDKELASAIKYLDLQKIRYGDKLNYEICVSEEIMRMQQGISLNNNLKKIGKYLTVLVEEHIEDEDTYIGRTEYDAREIDNSVIFTSKRKLNPGEFVTVKIVDAFDYDITGEVEDEFSK